MEHLDGVIDKPESDMTPQELQLHYFKMHDYDGNNLLDGLELATAITHVHTEVSCFKLPALTAVCLCNARIKPAASCLLDNPNWEGKIHTLGHFFRCVGFFFFSNMEFHGEQ